MTDHDEELLAELLLQWEELYERGQDSSPAELCRDCPHLVEELGKRIAAMKATDWLNNPDCGEETTHDSPVHASGELLGGRYRLDGRIATGGFAEVWRAFDTELQRIVAIKLPKPSRLASTFNFITEARRVARLKHPGIVPVFDVGTERNRCFIVSEYVEGGSLADRLAKTPPPIERTIRWLGDISAALEHAHLHGVIHRDVKPANILIDLHGRALLADFGIAQSAQKTGTFAPSLGTLRYMSPEQLEGKVATPQSDVYSLGVVLHECLTGDLPYEANEPTQLRKEILGGTKQLTKVAPGALMNVCQKAMQRLPHERHSSAAHFAAELNRAAIGPPRRPWWGNPYAWLTAALVLTVIGLAVTSSLSSFIRTSPPRTSRVPQPPIPNSQPITNQEPAFTPKPVVRPLASRTNSIGMTLIEIPAGSFLMGTHTRRHEHKVQITRPFYLGQTEVTNAQWTIVMGGSPSELKDDDRPVTHINWEDATEYCRRLSARPEEKAAGMMYRLPTEAEWEYACRAGTTTRHWFGDDDAPLSNYAWLHSNAQGKTHPVGKKKPNPWGLYDMRGNVWEWCKDWYDVTYYDPKELVVDPQGPTYSPHSTRLIAGGSWYDNPDSYLHQVPPETRNQYTGVRVVAVLHEETGAETPDSAGPGLSSPDPKN